MRALNDFFYVYSSLTISKNCSGYSNRVRDIAQKNTRYHIFFTKLNQIFSKISAGGNPRS